MTVYTNVCRECHKERQSASDAKYAVANKDKIKEKNRKYKIVNREYINKYKRALRKKRRLESQEVDWHTTTSDGFTRMTYTRLIHQR